VNTNHCIIDTIIERVRFMLNTPSTDKYTDDYIVRHLLNEKWCEVIGALNMSSECVVTLKLEFTLDTTKQFYQLPPMVGGIRRVVQYDETTNAVIQDWRPDNDMHPHGFGWRVNGNNVFELSELPAEEQDWSIEYIPTGDGLMHRGTCTITDESTVVLGTTPALGLMDRRENAYAGWILRSIPPNGTSPIQERLVESFNVIDRTLALRLPLTLGSTYDIEEDDNDIIYELSPPSYLPLLHACAAKVAMAFGPAQDLSQKKLMSLDVEYQNAIKSVRDLFGNRIERVPKAFNRYTLDNPNWGLDFYRG